MNLIVLLISLVQWPSAVVLFEAAFMAFRTRITGRISKLMLVRIWWSLLGLSLLLHGVGGLVQFLFPLLPIALSHIHVTANSAEAEIISLKKVVVNIPTGLRLLFQSLRPFIR